MLHSVQSAYQPRRVSHRDWHSALHCGMSTHSAVCAASALALTLLTLPSPRLEAQRVTASPAQRPALVVQITVDQLRPDYFERFATQLTGGLGRLMRQGARYTNAVHDHATTETAPGHATLWSGRYPSHTGVVINDIGVVDAQSTTLFGRGGGASPYRFRGSALFDWIRSDDQFSRALSVSRKDRGAILPLGRAKQEVYWYSLDGRFTTSHYYADTLPTWVQRFNATDFTAKFLGAQWNTLLDAAQYPERDSVDYEHEGKDFTFPHTLSADRRTGTYDFTEFPWMDDVTVDLALAGVNALKLGAGSSMDVLAVSLSTTDAVGHRYGPESRELHDQVLRVDRALGRLIDSLYKMRDSSRIVFALSADHGVAPYPQSHFAGTDPDRGRVNAKALIDTVRKALFDRGVDSLAIELQSGIISLDRAKLASQSMNADSLIESVRRALLRRPGVLRVDRVSQLAAAAARGDKIATRWAHSLPLDMPAVLTVTLKPYFYWYATRNATHGTPYDYDARIPLVFMGPMFVAGTHARPVRSVDIAPTLAAAIGIEPIEPLDGHVLRDAMRPAAAGQRHPVKRGSP